MNTKNKILIGIIAGLILMLLIFNYREIKRNDKIDRLEKQIIKTEFIITQLKDKLIRQGKISDSLFVIAKTKDSLIIIKEQQITAIQIKYNKIKNKVKELSKEESVLYLSERLKNTSGYRPSKYPILVEYDKTPIVMIDTNGVRQINLTFVDLDAKKEELDTTKRLIEIQKEQISDLYKVVESKDKEVKICNEIVINQDTLIKNQNNLIKEKDNIINKLNRQNKIKSYVISTLSGIVSVFSILIIL